MAFSRAGPAGTIARSRMGTRAYRPAYSWMKEGRSPRRGGGRRRGGGGQADVLAEMGGYGGGGGGYIQPWQGRSGFGTMIPAGQRGVLADVFGRGYGR